MQKQNSYNFMVIEKRNQELSSSASNLKSVGVQDEESSPFAAFIQRQPVEVHNTLNFIGKGSHLIKVRSKSKKYCRYFKINNSGLKLIYTDSKKGKSSRKKLDDQSEVSLIKILEIRDGPHSDVFIKAFHGSKSTSQNSCCFSVVIAERNKTLDLIAHDEETKKLWLNGLNYLMKKLTEADYATKRNLYLRETFRQADVNEDGTLSFKEIIKLMERLNMRIDEAHARSVFDLMVNSNASRKGDSLNVEEFILLAEMINKREEFENIFKRYDFGNGYMSADNLLNFFKMEQRESCSLGDCKKMIADLEVCPSMKEDFKMGPSAFQAMFVLEQMNIKDVKCGEVYQDMDRPMSHYFINSSHNTYLEKDQLCGPSKVECYIRALKLGCRCVELDVWDGLHGEPVIYHGHTLTSKIIFKDVIEAINRYAFEISDFPVILSIENHCSVEQQIQMAGHMKTIFGSKLFNACLPPGSTCLPSPNKLKGRIIVKGKKLPELSEDDDDDVSDEDEAADIDDEHVKEDVAKQQGKKSKQKLAKELSDCVVFCQSVSFKSFEESKQKTNFKQMSSFMEKNAMSLVNKQGSEFIQQNIWQLSRIYPAGTRTDSSNYDPVPMWLAGCQIVALNYQTADESMHVNKAKFEDNAHCGYILKPKFMRDPRTQYNLLGPYPSEWRQDLKLTIISGSQLPKKNRENSTSKSILDPYVKVDIFGVPADRQEKKTEFINNNGFHPVWNQQLHFVINCPEMAIVPAGVFDNEPHLKDVLVAQYGLPLTCMQNGFRTVHLKTDHGEPLKMAKLFIHCNRKSPAGKD